MMIFKIKTDEKHIKANSFLSNQLSAFLTRAVELGYQLKKVVPESFVMILESQYNGHKSQLNIYWNRRIETGKKFTVQTTITHPKKGRNQLNRKGLRSDDVMKVIENPRHHTNKGYYKK